MSQQRQYQMVGGGSNAGQFGDTTYTKIFVGGLAWETQRETMRRYFEQFGEILEAVVITDKNTGRSKGYGFVTFKDPDSAMRACQDPSPVIDGRRANCNLASLGAQKTRTSAPQHGMERFRPTSGSTAQSASTYSHQPTPQYAFPYSAYRYSGYPQDVYAMNYYNVYGGQQFSPYYTNAASGSPGVYYNYYPFYAQYGQSGSTQGFGIQYAQTSQYPYLPQQYRGVGILSLPTSPSPANSATGVATMAVAASAGSSGTASEQNLSA
ncbi:hypothetical protein L1049_021240 [Liquidambar formosana]|uniref:RRM domain-containing protein n=1 Tax=Liquidambar formosana TaxID=63359 RepID=A0AAP0SCJ5_LIQFO